MGKRDTVDEIFVHLGEEHLSALGYVENSAFDNAWSREDLRALLADEKVLCLGVLKAGQLAAYALAYLEEARFHLASMAVAPQYRRQGLGEELLGHLLGECRSRGCSRCTLEVRAGNRAARELYEKMGFTTVQRRGNYYENPPEDGLEMQLTVEIL